MPCTWRQVAVRDHVLGTLRDAFQRHGAVPMASQELGLASDADPPGAVQLLTPAGSKLALVRAGLGVSEVPGGRVGARARV